MSSPSSEAGTARLAHPEPWPGVHPLPDPARAQPYVNFVVVGPRSGSAWRVAEATVRGESARDYSTLRYVLEDAQGRRLRVKQYNHDWWIPTVSDISFRKPGRPIVFDDSVAFVGRDYRRHEASCGHRWGTGVELSVETGSLTDAEWVSVWSGLDALDPAAVPQARRTSFARRSYWNRWGRSDAPWDSTEISGLRWSDPTSAAMDAAAWAITADRWAPIPGTVDSLGTREGPQGPEVQAVFRWPMSLNCSAWLRVLKSPPEPWKPLIDSGEVNRPAWSNVKVAERPAQRACMDASVGNWYFAWREGSRAYELHLRARKGLDARAADAVLGGLLA